MTRWIKWIPVLVVVSDHFRLRMTECSRGAVDNYTKDQSRVSSINRDLTNEISAATASVARL